MRALSAEPGFATCLLAAATGVWWLSSLALLPGLPTDATVAISARAAAVCITGQWMMIALLTPHWIARTGAGEALPMLAFACLPLWPLLVMLWAASGIPALTLAATQLGATVVFAAALIGRMALTRLPVAEETAQQLAITAGASFAGIIWVTRYLLAGWFHP